MMNQKLVVVIAFVVIGSCFTASSFRVHATSNPNILGETQKKKPLSLLQIQKLITAGTPDDVIAGEIGDRGINFGLDNPTIASLAKRGAGPRTVGALTVYLPKGSIVISSSPSESRVLVDDSFLGQTDAAGMLKLTNVPAGQHKITIRNSRYREGVFVVNLEANEEEHVTARLELVVGFLSVDTMRSARIEISGIGRFDGPLNRLEIPAGAYAVTVSRPLHFSATKDITVATGKETSLSVALEVDQEAVNRLIASARTAYSRKQYDRAASLARELLAAMPQNSDALTVLASSYFSQSNFLNFTETASQALDAGASLDFELKHHHSLGSSLHPVRITVTNQSISYDPQTVGAQTCSYRSFTVPLKALKSVEIAGNRRNEIYLRLKFADVSNPKKTSKLNFADAGSYFVRGQKTTAGGFIQYVGDTMVSRREADSAMSALVLVLQYARTSNQLP